MTVTAITPSPAITEASGSSPLYETLPGDSIRLLRLLPSDSPTAPLLCTLQTELLFDADCPSYHAISYAWAEAVPSAYSRFQHGAPIICNGHITRIPLNLFCIFIRLRSQPDKCGTFFWADSICINQDDIHERNTQVAMMRGIFERSAEVLLWLGETSDGAALSTITSWTGGNQDKQIMKNYQDSFWRWERQASQRWSQVPASGPDEVVSWPRYVYATTDYNTEESNDEASLDLDIFGIFCLLSHMCQGESASRISFYESPITTQGQMIWSRRVVRSLWTMIEREWWKRIWIVQECVLARKATVMLGPMAAPWSMFADAARQHMKSRQTTTFERAGDSRDPLVELSRRVLELEWARMPLVLGLGISPLPILQRFHGRKATDPRDKIFGLLGLLGEELVVPDYSMGTDDVFIETAARLITQLKNLDILGGLRSTNASTFIPSWCIDWGRCSQYMEWDRLNCFRHYHASAGLEAAAVYVHRPTNERPILQVTGYQVDTVEETTYAIAPPDGGFSGLRAVQAQWANQFISRVNKAAFWRALCGDLIYLGGSIDGESKFARAKASDVKAFDSWLVDDTRNSRRKTSYHGTTEFAYVPPEKVSTKRNSFFYAMQAMTSGRRMFLTSTGRIGVGPEGVRAGDVILVLPGSRVPLVARQAATERACGPKIYELIGSDQGKQAHEICGAEGHDCHFLIGDAYIAGMMDGEGVRLDQGRELTEFYFV